MRVYACRYGDMTKAIQAYRIKIFVGEVDIEIAIKPSQKPDQFDPPHPRYLDNEFFNLPAKHKFFQSELFTRLPP